MANAVDFGLVMGAGFLATASPGPATLSVIATAMANGRRQAFILGSGIMTGSLIWSSTAALGLGAVMLAHAWLFEALRYIGAGYLLWLAYRSARSAISKTPVGASGAAVTGTPGRTWRRGLMIHLTNPKAILFFGALYSVGVPPGTPLPSLLIIIAALAVQSALIFTAYALLFSNPAMARLYVRARRWFEGSFALAFGYTGLRLFTARLG